eukprot:SAG11_NODE_4976_length_1705_cov_809.993773_4_plen_26_part_01
MLNYIRCAGSELPTVPASLAPGYLFL